MGLSGLEEEIQRALLKRQVSIVFLGIWGRGQVRQLHANYSLI